MNFHWNMTKRLDVIERKIFYIYLFNIKIDIGTHILYI